jgi:SAM-dependent methyltransferase
VGEPSTPHARELAYHEKLYSGFAQTHFARPGIRALRRDIVKRVLQLTGAGAHSRVLSLGCGIGDTELALAPHVREVLGLDLSPKAIEQARADAGRLGIGNARFELSEPGWPGIPAGAFDVVIAVFLLHHLPDPDLERLPAQVQEWLTPGGVFYSLDPSSSRLTGAVGRLLIPGLMKRYESPDERELNPVETAALFERAGFRTRQEMYDFGAVPFVGLFPGWETGFNAVRAIDDFILRIGALRRLASDFEVIATRP